jgi:hypothetical protein
MRRQTEYRRYVACLDDAATVHDGDPVAGFRDNGQIVGNKNNSHATLVA